MFSFGSFTPLSFFGMIHSSAAVFFRSDYLEQRKRDHNIPSVWMVQMEEIAKQYSGWRSAVVRFYGSLQSLQQDAGLVPVHEWKYFERQFELMLALQEYCDEHFDGDYSKFPTVFQLQKGEGHARLVRLIQDHGGSNIVALRFGMTLPHRISSWSLNWGPFDLECGIALMGLVRNDHLQRIPPLRPAGIFMPTRTALLEIGKDGLGERLDEQIMNYGGYENMARRLGLAWSGSNADYRPNN